MPGQWGQLPVHLTKEPLSSVDPGQPPTWPHEECQWSGTLLAGIQTTRSPGQAWVVLGMLMRGPQLNEQWLWFYLISLLTCKMDGRQTNMREHHRTRRSSLGTQEEGGGLGRLWAQEQGGARNQNEPLSGGSWERIEEQRPRLGYHGFPLSLSGRSN